MNTILIVDDHAASAAKRERCSRPTASPSSGEADDGISGLAAARSMRPDLVLLDIGLPDVEGFEVARALAVDGPPPLVVLTSSREASAYGPAADQQPQSSASSRRTSCRARRSGPWSPARDPAARPRRRLAPPAGGDRPAARRGRLRGRGPGGRCAELLAAVREQRPDVAIVDIRMPPTHTDEGLRAAEAIRAEHGTAVGILVLSQYVETTFALRLVADGAGGVGYLLKDRVDDLDDFADADPSDRQGRLGHRSGGRGPARRPAAGEGPLDDLTEREARGPGADGGRPLQSGDLRPPVPGARRRSRRTSPTSSRSSSCCPAPDDHRRVLAVLAHLRG